MKLLQSTDDPLDAYVEISTGKLFPLFIDRALEVVTNQTEEEFLDSWNGFTPNSQATAESVQEEWNYKYVTPETVIQP